MVENNAQSRSAGLFIPEDKEYTRRHPARFILFKECWLAMASWERGDDKPAEWSFTGDGDLSLPEPAMRLIVERERVEA